MSTKIENNFRQSKQAASYIHKFNYHLQHTVPSFLPSTKNHSSPQQSPTIASKKGLRSMNFHFAEHSVEGVGTIDAQTILLSALKIYVGPDCVKLSESSYKKSHTMKASYLPIYGQFEEIIEFCIVDNNEEKLEKTSSKWAKQSKITNSKTKDSDKQNSVLKSTMKTPLSNNYELFVIHYCHSQEEKKNHMKWESFVEKYHFKEEFQNGELASKIYYKCIFNYEADQGLLSYCSYKEQLCDKFIKEHLFVKNGQLNNISLLQGHLLQNKDRVSQKFDKLNDPAFDESHKKWMKLSPEYFKMFTAIKKHTVKEYRQIHGESDHFDDQDLSSLTYRYMVAKQFEPSVILECVTEYLKWQKHLSESYNLIMFERFHNIDFYTFLGHDHDGRAVILNKSSHLLVDKIDSIDDYCHYMMYYIEVYIPRKLKGFASEYIVLADVHNLCSDNFKLAITKRNIHEGTHYCPERQNKLIAFNVGPWGSSLWKLFKFLIPKRTIAKINLLSEDKNQIMEALLQLMDISVIPEYLGGKNKRTYKDDLLDQQEYLRTKSQQN